MRETQGADPRRHLVFHPSQRRDASGPGEHAQSGRPRCPTWADRKRCQPRHRSLAGAPTTPEVRCLKGGLSNVKPPHSTALSSMRSGKYIRKYADLPVISDHPSGLQNLHSPVQIRTAPPPHSTKRPERRAFPDICQALSHSAAGSTARHCPQNALMRARRTSVPRCYDAPRRPRWPWRWAHASAPTNSSA